MAGWRFPTMDSIAWRCPFAPSDEVIITARAPGYLPSTAHIHGNQLSAYGSRLNFGLVSASGAAPTLPGDLGTIQLRGIVYNAARGVKSPIAQAAVIIVHNSIVQPTSQIDVTTSMIRHVRSHAGAAHHRSA